MFNRERFLNEVQAVGIGGRQGCGYPRAGESCLCVLPQRVSHLDASLVILGSAEIEDLRQMTNAAFVAA
jgi:hypothetical protein